MPPIRVLVVDDSVVIRRIVTMVLTEDPDITVVGSAPNGKAAIEKVDQLLPDAVTLDVEMPIMDGVTAVRHIRRKHPRLPVVMFSTLTERGAEATLDALAAGASDYVTKPANVGSVAQSMENMRTQLIPKLKALVAARRPGIGASPVPRPMLGPGSPSNRPASTVPTGSTAPTAPTAPIAPSAPATVGRVSPVAARIPTARPSAAARGSVAVLAIASSTGGPDALTTVIPSLPADLSVPVVLVQHMPPVFTKLFAQRLDHKSRLSVREAQHGEVLAPGTVYVAPGDFHLSVERRGTTVHAVLTQTEPENFCRPAADVLFRSVAKVYGRTALGLVLTGMGHDGAKGAEAMVTAGGRIFIQDEATSVVWGMPGAVSRAGVAECTLPLSDIAPAVLAALPMTTARATAGTSAGRP
jgi:two-component system, chemotaxis family, protein-glutamate methylesterase/glutaminase